MRINSKLGVQHAAFDGKDAGEGLAIFFSQEATALSRYRFLVKAETDQGNLQVGSFYSSPPQATSPNGQLTRMLASAVCPGARSWTVDVSCADAEITPETADIVLVSSKCCTAPVGVTRVAERYIAHADTAIGGTIVITVPPGRTVKSFSALASGGVDGSVVLNGLTTIIVPAGFSSNAEPGAPFIGVKQMTFNDVVFFIEYLESA